MHNQQVATYAEDCELNLHAICAYKQSDCKTVDLSTSIYSFDVFGHGLVSPHGLALP